MKKIFNQLKTAVILSVFAVILFGCFFVASWFCGYSSGKVSSAVLFFGSIPILILNYIAYRKENKEQ